MEDYKHYEEANQFLQHCNKLATALHKPKIDQQVVNLARISSQRSYEHHPNLLVGCSFISFTPQNDGQKTLNLEAVYAHPKTVTVTRIHSVANAQFQLIPNFYAARNQKGQNKRLQSMQQISRSMTDCALNADEVDRRFINSFQLPTLLESFRLELCRQPETVSKQLRRIQNILRQHVVDPRILAKRVCDFLLAVVNGMCLQKDDFEHLVSVTKQAVCLLNTYMPNEAVRSILYIVERAKHNPQVLELLKEMAGLDFFATYAKACIAMKKGDPFYDQLKLL